LLHPVADPDCFIRSLIRIASSKEARLSSMALFEERQVRRLFHNDEWWFVVVDIVLALTDSANPSDYLKKLRRRDPALGEAFEGGGQIVPPFRFPLKLRAASSAFNAGMSPASCV
jgi:hypothetical protein